MSPKNEQTIKYSTLSLIKDIGKYIKPYRGKFIAGSLLRLTCDLANLYPAIALASVVTFFTKYKTGEPLNYFWLILALWSLSAIWRNIGNHLGKYYIFKISEKTALDAQLEALQRLFSLDIAWHEKENAGNKLKKIQRGSSGLDRILRMWVNNYIEIGVNFIGIIFILGRTSKTIGFVMFVFMVTYSIISILLLKKATAATETVNMKEEEMQGLIFQAINNIRSVKVSGISGKIYDMVNSQAKDLFEWIKKRIFHFQLRASILNAWSISFRLGATAIIAYGIMRGTSDLGFLILFNMYFLRVLESANELSDSTQDLIINKLSIARMQDIITQPHNEDDHGKISFPKNWKKINIRNLSFSYGKQQVLKDISFDINKGERIGIVGLSGAGKSTLFKLFLKESENYGGEIMIDGVSIKGIKKNSYYDNVSVVLQDTEVFNFSLKDNIIIASDKKNVGRNLKQAIEISHVSDYIKKLPNGIETFIGEKGIKLSGGEKQRLGIARAIYKKPDILFLDEATSHLDLESEEKIKDSLHAFFQKVTAIVIAHRLTTIKEMDKILVIEKGELVESGNFKELYGKRGRFYKLWEKQKL